MIQKIAFVAHPSKHMEEAKRFYGELLGLKLDAQHSEHWTEYCAPDGKVIALDGYSPDRAPGSPPYLALETDDIVEEVARLRVAGTPILLDVLDNGTCKMAIIEDPNGHRLMLHEIAPERAQPKP